MKVKVPFIAPSNGHTAQLVVKVTCDKRPLFASDGNCFCILPIDSYEIVEKESTEDINKVFELTPHLDKMQLIVGSKNKGGLFYMGCADESKEGSKGARFSDSFRIKKFLNKNNT